MNNKEKILMVALDLWPEITYQAVADKVGLTRQGVSYLFPDKSLKSAVARYAVETGHSPVIVQLMASNHAAVRDMRFKDRIRHFMSLKQNPPTGE